MTDLFGVDQFELHVASGPDDQVAVSRVVQQREQELPELQRAAALVRQTLLLHLNWLVGHNSKVNITPPSGHRTLHLPPSTLTFQPLWNNTGIIVVQVRLSVTTKSCESGNVLL